MIYNRKTKMAMNICFKAHYGQTDKAGFPYAAHPLWVAERMSTEAACCVALLHDVCEDNDQFSIDYIRKLFGDEIADAVDAITRRSGETYFGYIDRLKKNKIARTVKLFDILHNTNSARVLEGCVSDGLVGRYQKAYQMLLQTESKGE